MPIWVGTSGWHYEHWRERFYPRGMTPDRWLSHYAERYRTVELNNAFYRLPDRTMFDRWAGVVPDDFIFAVKASRYLTHVRRLRDPGEPVNRLMHQAEGLGAKLGPVLLQLPPNLKADPEALNAALRAFPRGVRVAVEPRHPSWFSDATRSVLERHQAALCLSDTDGRGPPHWRTADWGYVRFHHGRAQPDSCYGRAALRTWAARLAELWPESTDVFAFFNNDWNGCALQNSRWFAAAVSAGGRSATRTPPARDVHL